MPKSDAHDRRSGMTFPEYRSLLLKAGKAIGASLLAMQDFVYPGRTRDVQVYQHQASARQSAIIEPACDLSSIAGNQLSSLS
jgi:hypothetical protein